MPNAAGHVERLEGVHPDLRAVVIECALTCPVPFMIVEGVRSDAVAYANFGKGRTVAECVAAGCPAQYAQPKLAKVTWLANPLNTKHRRQKTGFGHAVDLLPAPYDWKDTAPFDTVARYMMDAAKRLGVTIRWGADWDADGKPRERGETDSPHFELAI